MLEDNGLSDSDTPKERAKITYTEEAELTGEEESHVAKSRLTELHSVQNVNAIKQNKEIPFSNNLTIIYGKNGSGKSGYIRLLNNAFHSRGDQKIIPNIFEPTDEPPQGTFKFSDNDNSTKELTFPAKKNSPEFANFAVFDSKSVSVHLNERNEIHIKPKELDFFEDLASATNLTLKKLENLIESKTSDNSFYKRLDGDSDLKTALQGISHETDLDKLKNAVSWTEEFTQDLEKTEKELVDLKSKSPEEKKKELQKIKDAICEIAKDSKNIEDKLTVKYFKSLLDQVQIIAEKKKKMTELGEENFKTDLLQCIGSENWKSFISSAYDFGKDQDESYPTASSSCILCRQSLPEEARKLIKAHWDYIESTAKTEYENAKSKLEILEKDLESTQTPRLQKDSKAREWLIANGSDLLKDIDQFSSDSEARISDLKKIVKSEEVSGLTDISFPETKVIEVTSKIDTEIENLNAEKYAENLGNTKSKLTTLNHRKSINDMIEEVEKFILNAKWINKALSARKSFSSKSITDTQKKISENILNKRYEAVFHQWSQRLRAPYKIDLKQRGSAGRSQRQLVVNNLKPGDVLSEGEQRAIALADFLTEAELSGIQGGLIFDDPVNSQDIERKEIIADTLAELSKSLQIIVFTHDLSFVYDLKNKAMIHGAEVDCHWIEKVKLNSGHVTCHSHPSLEKAFVEPTEAVERLKKAQLEEDPKERIHYLQQGMSLLRSSYEAFVLNDILNGAVSRFDRHVKLHQLEEAYFDSEYVSKARSKYTYLSGFVDSHLQPDSTSYQSTIEKLEEEIKEYRIIRQEYSTKKKAVRKAEKEST